MGAKTTSAAVTTFSYTNRIMLQTQALLVGTLSRPTAGAMEASTVSKFPPCLRSLL